MKASDDQFNFENLIVYQKALDYVDIVYTITGKFPPVELYELGRQFRRASYSIALNIGEGESDTDREFLRFLRYSQRSVGECLVCSVIARRRNYITEEESLHSRKLLSELARMISSLSRTISKRCN